MSLQDVVTSEGKVIEEPLRVANAAAVEWADEADAVVVGFGGAGAAAALEAREKNLDVVVIDRFQGGGSTAYSGGVYYAGNTRFQRDAGYNDTPQDLFNYLAQERKDAVSEETLRQFCEESGESVEWLVGHGVRFEGSLYSGKTNYPPEDKFLYYSGNEKVPAFAAKAKPAPRGHRTVAKGWSGYAFFGALEKSAYAHGVRARSHCRAMRLVMDASDSVIGVEVLELEKPEDQQKHQALYKIVDPMKPFNAEKAEKAMIDAAALEQSAGKRKLIRARHGVVLSTGGFSYNVKMVGKHMPFLAERNEALIRLGSAGCSGSGIQLGASVGGSVGKLDRSFLGRMIVPPNALVSGLIVNQRGQRFCNEDAYNAILGNAIMEQPGGDAWIILDKELHRKLLWQLIPRGDGAFVPYIAPAILNLLFGGTKKAKTLTALAQKAGIDPAGLERTVADANAAIAAGRPDPTGKNPDYARPLGKGPYWALNTSIGNKFSFCIFFTLGGLRVDEKRGVVLRDNGTSINGLYAAGRAAMGIPSDGYISGLSLADCVFSGRRAARDIALKRPNQERAA